MKLYTICFFLLLNFSVYAQEKLNQLDEDGRRHGPWKEYFDEDSGQLKFEGEFVHGKRTGLFRFYQEGLKNPAATMFFDPNSDTVEVKYLSQAGKTISEGQMLNQKRTGRWTYYHKNSDKIMMTENYVDGKLHGKQTTYYDTGKIAEEANYQEGLLQGERLLYSEKGVILEQLNYDRGELHGPAKFFNGKGELRSEGSYKRDKHHGTWKYYENGQLKEEKDYSDI